MSGGAGCAAHDFKRVVPEDNAVNAADADADADGDADEDADEDADVDSWVADCVFLSSLLLW